MRIGAPMRLEDNDKGKLVHDSGAINVLVDRVQSADDRKVEVRSHDFR